MNNRYQLEQQTTAHCLIICIPILIMIRCILTVVYLRHISVIIKLFGPRLNRIIANNQLICERINTVQLTVSIIAKVVLQNKCLNSLCCIANTKTNLSGKTILYFNILFSSTSNSYI